SCAGNQECESGYCDGICGDCVIDSHCPQRQYCLNDTKDVINTCGRALENGINCKRGSQCLSTFCFEICQVCTEDSHCPADQYCKDDVDTFFCTPKLPFASECSRNTQCTPGFCDGLCGACITADDCGTGGDAMFYCRGEGSTSIASECFDLLDNGRRCNGNEYCKNGLCHKSICRSCVNSTLTNCEPEQYCNRNEFTCKAKQKNGRVCPDGDEQCFSEFCFRGRCRNT
ncbi:unnamed protein product, partial [Owenia fusiformis]